MYREMFPAKIKSLREKSGLSLREVEKDTGIIYTTLSKYEAGTLEPDLEKLGILADYYEISIDWLLSTAGGSKSPKVNIPINSNTIKTRRLEAGNINLGQQIIN